MARTWDDGASQRAHPARWAVAIAVSAAAFTGLSDVPRVSATTDTPSVEKGSLRHIAEVVGAVDAYRSGVTGMGVGVAVIDTGIAPVQGLASGNVVDGVDLSRDAGMCGEPGLDSYGHGTHMASAVAGRDAVDTPAGYAAGRAWHGIAPDAHVVNVKVGGCDGAADASDVIKGIDWVIAHRSDPQLNIRVLSLAYGADSAEAGAAGALAAAVRDAWRSGIVVVTAAGNDGQDVERLASPAHEPVVLAVGAADTAGTTDPSDDSVPSFPNRGSAERHVDLVAPGMSVQGLRVPGSIVDGENPKARVGQRFFKGTGTSQATAVTAGAAALLLQRHPELTPDQVKRHLMATARPLGPDALLSGSGMIDVAAALRLPVSAVAAGDAAGVGSVRRDADAASAESADAWTGRTWTGRTWTGRTWTGRTWTGRTWTGRTWTGDAWTGRTWTGRTWTGRTWTGDAWTGRTWTGRTWTGRTWTGDAWTGRTWTGRTWTGDAWTGRTWTGDAWTGRTWTGRTWTGEAWTGRTWTGRTWTGSNWS